MLSLVFVFLRVFYHHPVHFYGGGLADFLFLYINSNGYVLVL
ncbi:hypothetical protein O23A_p1531 [Aeromonas salmonicida]|nr:hypothetical protein O23A_p1531 [Aeromonas salmonicida]